VPLPGGRHGRLTRHLRRSRRDGPQQRDHESCADRRGLLDYCNAAPARAVIASDGGRRTDRGPPGAVGACGLDLPLKGDKLKKAIANHLAIFLLEELAGGAPGEDRDDDPDHPIQAIGFWNNQRSVAHVAGQMGRSIPTLAGQPRFGPCPTQNRSASACQLRRGCRSSWAADRRDMSLHASASENGRARSGCGSL
jgi:hypothetical protein